MTSDRTILITGVTGNQGGAVAQALRGTGFHLRGLTRMPAGERAGAWGVFGGQNAAEAGVEREEAQGSRLATLAREAGVEHYVYTSVGSAYKQTGHPEFRQQVAHRGNRARPSLPLSSDRTKLNHKREEIQSWWAS
jgi:nucleoside-diphosphate-sugar epimerase